MNRSWAHLPRILTISIMIAAGSHVGALPAAAAEPAHRVAQANPAELTRVRLAVLVAPLLVNSALMIARDRGLFAKNGVDVEFVSIDATPAGLAALSAGTVQFSFTGPNIIDAVAAGVPLVIVFTL